MTHRYIKIGATAVVLVGALAGLMWSTLREGTEYFKNIDEVVTNRPAWEGKRLQLHGYVVPGTWVQRPNSLDYKFKVQNNPARQTTSGGVVDASYTGILPDTFKDEAEVVLKGKFGPEGFHVEPNGVMAKCPSKYEAAAKSASAGS
ncbi:MAG: cytochrome c maturation protein CcmE [Acidobacteria bacterium]|nr:cytochrome c maturation protein CcmE [Acidobacteriota bacterium]